MRVYVYKPDSLEDYIRDLRKRAVQYRKRAIASYDGRKKNG